MKKYLAFGLLGILIVLALFGRTLAAGDQTYTVNSNYKIAADGNGTISHTIDAKAGTNPAVIVLPLAGSDQTSVSARVGDAEAKTAISEDGATVTVTIPESAGATWRLAVSYKASLVKNLGSVQAAQAPALEGIGLTIDSQKTVVAADLGVGLATAMPSPDKTDIATGQQIFTYENKTGPVPDTVTLLFNDETTALVDMNVELKNDSWWWNTVELTLPPDTNQQQTILSSLEPAPSNVRLDQDGNILAQYNMRPKQSMNVAAKMAINVRNINYDLDSEAKLAEIDQQITDLYTKQTDKWYGGQIEVEVNPVAPAAEIVKSIYDAVVVQAKSNSQTAANPEFIGINVDSSSKYPDLLIGELRSNGVPARAVLGKLASDGQFVLEESVDHVWVEAYLPDVGWVTLDPSMATSGDYFSKGDAMHVGLALWGVSDHLPPVNFSNAIISYGEEVAEVPSELPEVTATKYVIFPGVSIMSVNVNMPTGVITDANAVEYSGILHQLGSLAPLQKASTKSFAFGSNSFSSEEVKYGYTDGETLVEELSTTQSSTSYVALIVIVVLLILIVLLFIVMRRRRSAKKYKPSKDSLIMHDEDDGGEVENIDMVGNKVVDEGAPVQQTAPPPPPPITNTPTEAKPQVTRGTINSSNNGNGFQQASKENPRRHIIQ